MSEFPFAHLSHGYINSVRQRRPRWPRKQGGSVVRYAPKDAKHEGVEVTNERRIGRRGQSIRVCFMKRDGLRLGMGTLFPPYCSRATSWLFSRWHTLNPGSRPHKRLRNQNTRRFSGDKDAPLFVPDTATLPLLSPQKCRNAEQNTERMMRRQSAPPMTVVIVHA